MAIQNIRCKGGKTADGSFESLQYHACRAGTTRDQVRPIAASTDRPYSIVLNNPKDGDEVELAEGDGIVKVRVDGNTTNIAIGDFLGVLANGRLGKVTADESWYICIAEEAATTDNALIEATFMGTWGRQIASA